MNRKEWILQTQKRLSAAGSPTPRLDGEVLLAHVLAVDRIHLHMDPDKEVPAVSLAAAENLLRRRESGEPVAYLTGTQEFMGLTFEVSSAVLLPRPDTELLVEEALALLKDFHCRQPDQPLLAADIGTGSGCISVSLAATLPYLQILATDLSEAALTVARRNIRRHGVTDQVIPLQGSLLEPVRLWLGNRKLDSLISNPPYISEAEMKTLDNSVAGYEPRGALAGGPEGLDFYRSLTKEAPDILRTGGFLAFEIGCRQGGAVAKLMTVHGFERVRVLKDLAGLDRVVLGWSP